MRRLPTLLLVSALAAAPALAQPKLQDTFINDKVEGDNAEILLGQLAQEHAASPAVRDFGRMLVQDHQTDHDKTLQVARQLGVKLTGDLAPETRTEARKLGGLAGEAFDREYVQYMIDDHQKDIREHEEQAKEGGVAGKLAQDSLPTLRLHLKAAQALMR